MSTTTKTLYKKPIKNLDHIMRTIKFRGKTQDGEWVYGYYLPSIYEDVDIITVLEDFNLNQKNYAVLKETVGQFTGLTDKNGKEIYEGDIATDGENIYTVEFSMWSYAFVWDKHGSQNNFHFEKDDNQEMELVGNIYDNPELRTKTEMK